MSLSLSLCDRVCVYVCVCVSQIGLGRAEPRLGSNLLSGAQGFLEALPSFDTLLSEVITHSSTHTHTHTSPPPLLIGPHPVVIQLRYCRVMMSVGLCVCVCVCVCVVVGASSAYLRASESEY